MAPFQTMSAVYIVFSIATSIFDRCRPPLSGIVVREGFVPIEIIVWVRSLMRPYFSQFEMRLVCHMAVAGKEASIRCSGNGEYIIGSLRLAEGDVTGDVKSKKKGARQQTVNPC